MRVEKLLKQLRREFIKVKILQSLLDGLIFFLGVNMILFLLNLKVFSNVPNIYAVTAVTFLFTISNLVYRSKKYRLELYEEENPELQEILRTARDNIDKQNIVSQALFDELLDKARRVTSESIIPTKTIIQKILIVGFLSFLTVMSGLADFQLLQNPTDLLPTPDQLRDAVTGGGNETGFELQNASGIYGDESDIDASDLEIDFNVTGTGQAENAQFDPTAAPPEEDLVLDSTGESFTADLDLAKEYSVAVKNIG
jgi:hypothetical protein